MTYSEEHEKMIEGLTKVDYQRSVESALEILMCQSCRYLAAIADELHELNAKKGEKDE